MGAKMNVLLVDVDSKIANLALMKISAYHKANGDTVGFKVTNPDKVYISCIFKKNKPRVQSAMMMLQLQYPNATFDVGGPGWDLHKELPVEIENCKPDYELYPNIDYALGFTTRGCIRHCPFCIVPIKEGKLHRIQDISEIYDPKFKQIKLLDNNILADMENFKRIAEFCIEKNIKVDLSQGLDIRLLTDDAAELLAQMKPMRTWVFAYDSPKYRDSVVKGIETLKRHMNVEHKVQFYVYMDHDRDGEFGYNSALKRVLELKELGVMAYIMMNRDKPATHEMKVLKYYANCPTWWFAHTWEEYLRWVGETKEFDSCVQKLDIGDE